MSERNRIVHVWLELKNNEFLANEYVGWYDEDLSEGGLSSSNLDDSFVYFSYSKYWKDEIIKRVNKFGFEPQDISYIFLLYDKNYRKDIPIGIMEQFSTVIYLGWVQYDLPELPKLKEISLKTFPPLNLEGEIEFYGKIYDRNIEYIRLAYEPIRSLKEFEIFPNLKTIHLIQHNLDIQIEKIEHIESLLQLRTLLLLGNKISKIENLEHISNLSILGIHNANIKKIENLDKSKNLIELNLSRNEIINIEGLDNLTKLQKLNLAENKIEKIENLNFLNQLIELDLHSNYIRVIENLNNLPLLETLNLSSNLIARVSSLDSLKKLKNLNLYNNQITNINNLENLKDLNKLMLGNNQIEKIENLGTLQKLNWLDLNHNSIEKIENLDALNNLEHLDLSENKIKILENLEGLRSLKSIIIWGNPIEFITEKTYEALLNNRNIKLGLKEMEYLSLTRFIDNYKIKIINE